MCSDDFANLAAKHFCQDFDAIGLAANQRLAEIGRLFESGAWRHWRFKWIDNGVHQCRSGYRERLSQDCTTFGRILDVKARAATSPGKRGKIDGMQVTAEFRVTKKHHLLPFDHAERFVAKHDYLDRQDRKSVV